MTGPIRTATLVFVSLAACAVPRWRTAPHDRLFQRAPRPRPHPSPAPRSPSEWWDAARQGGIRPVAEAVSPGRHLRRLAGGTTARDVNAFGQVPDSSWFENRAGRRAFTPADFGRPFCGCRVPGPAPGPLLVLSGKTEGATPGFVVRDSARTTWLVKFDAPAFPELASGAEATSTRLLFAAGYHVPENHVVTFDPRRLRISSGATSLDDYNRTIPFTRRDMTEMLHLLNPDPDGGVRALFSRVVPGRPLGPFAFSGVRQDDPGDRIPHQHRRSLRGLWVFAAWLNHTEAWQENTLDSFVPERPGSRLGHVAHHLVDFNATLGAGGVDPRTANSGYGHWIDWPTVGKRLGALGLYYPYWLAVQKSPYRAVGVFEAHVFDPARWRPDVPNPAFDEATLDDSYWAASILARISPEVVRAAVREARFTEPGAGSYVARVLLARREKLLRHIFDKVLALDLPRVERGTRLSLVDLEVQAGLARARRRCYQWQARWNRRGARDPELGRGVAARPELDLAPLLARARRRGAAFDRDPFLTLSFWRVDDGVAGPRVELHLRAACGGLVPVGLEREGR